MGVAIATKPQLIDLVLNTEAKLAWVRTHSE